MNTPKRTHLQQLVVDIKEAELSLSRLDKELVDLDILLGCEMKKIHGGMNIAATKYTKYHNEWQIIYEEIEITRLILEDLTGIMNSIYNCY